MNAITYITRLPQLTPKLRELELAIDYWKQMHAEAGSQKEQAWRQYNEAVDNEQPFSLISDLLGTAMLFDDICRDTWEEFEAAKKQLLELLN